MKIESKDYSEAKNTHKIELKYVVPKQGKPNAFYHCYALNSVFSEWDEVLQHARKMLFA